MRTLLGPRGQGAAAAPSLAGFRVGFSPSPSRPAPLIPLYSSNSSCPLSPGHRGPAHPHSHRSHRAMSSLPGCQLWRLPSASPKQVSLAPCSPAGLMKTAKQNCVGRIVVPRRLETFMLSPLFPPLLPCFFPSCLSYFLYNFLFFTQNNFPTWFALTLL